MFMASPFALLLLVLLALSTPRPSLQISNCGYCVCDRPSITCDFEKSRDRFDSSGVDLSEFAPSSSQLGRLSLDPLAYRELYINCKSSRTFRSQRLTRQMLRDFANLVRLSVLKCDLVDIEPDAFADLTYLQSLDVSNNRLTSLSSGLFHGRSLSVLTLSENPGLRLSSEAFRNFTLERLVLTNCGLTAFPWESVRTLAGLQELTLSNNAIRTVPLAAAPLVTRLQVLYLDGNPLSCYCYSRWLRDSIDWERVSPPIIKSAKLPKCASPPTLRGVNITRLASSDFACPAPQLRSVDIRLEADSAELVCTADASPDEGAQYDDQAPLEWTYRHQAVYPDRPNGYPSRTYHSRGATFRQMVRRTPGYQRERYSLVATGQDGHTANFSLTVNWPDSEPQGPEQKKPLRAKTNAAADGESTTKLGLGDASIRNEGANAKAEPGPPDAHANGDYFSRKQFTLIEMIIAVVGTFMATSLIFLLACQFVQWHNKRGKKRLAAGYAAAGPPYAYSYNSHRPASHSQHEYDVPRLDSLQQHHHQHHQQALLPKPPPPPPPPSQPPPPLPPPSHTQATTSSTTLISTKPPGPLPMPPQTTSGVVSSSSAASAAATVGMASLGDMEFLEYGGHRLMFGHAA